MDFDAQRLLQWPIAPVQRRYGRRDAMLYALGIGLGSDPCSADELRFVYEKDLQALPSFSTVLAYPFLWYAEPGTGVDLVNVVHAEMGFENFGPLPVEGTVRGTTRVTGVEDKGARVGALLSTECTVADAASGQPLCRLVSSSLARAHGGFAVSASATPPPAAVRLAPWPDRPPDAHHDIATLPQAALVYRLSGDANPLHADPAQARKAGFPGPLLHGRCTFGVAAWALLQLCCGYDPLRLRHMRARFSSPVFPGEVVRTEVWREGAEVRFRALVPQRGATVLSHGVAGIG